MTSLFEIAAIVQRQRRQPLSAETNRPPGALEVKVIDWGNRKHSHRARNVVKRIFLQPRHIREKNHIREKALLAISIWFNIWWQASSWFANPITGMNVRQVRVFMMELYIRLFLSCHNTELKTRDRKTSWFDSKYPIWSPRSQMEIRLAVKTSLKCVRVSLKNIQWCDRLASKQLMTDI